MKMLCVLAAAAILLTGCVSNGESSPQTIRVMSYNIHHGRGMDGQVDLERIAALIKHERADIVALQEVDRGVERTDRRDFPRELSKLTGMEVYFDRNIFFQGGEYGNAVLTRFPILKKSNTHLRMLRAGEQRGVMEMILNVRGKKVLFMNTHIDYRGDDSERLQNIAQFKEILAGRLNLPVIFCGDFNDVPGSRTHARMKELLDDAWEKAGQGDGFTIPSTAPNKRIDYIWISERVHPKEIHVPQTLASDHLPVVAELEIR